MTVTKIFAAIGFIAIFAIGVNVNAQPVSMNPGLCKSPLRPVLVPVSIPITPKKTTPKIEKRLVKVTTVKPTQIHEFQLDKMTLSIAYGQACKAANDGEHKPNVLAKTIEILGVYNPDLTMRDATLSSRQIVKQAFDDCQSLGSN